MDKLDETLGIKAIVALQALVGIKETESQARKGWHAMSTHDKKKTMLAYALFFSDKPA